MRMLVTGGAGFIGTNLARTLIARGHEVVVLDDLSTGYRSNTGLTNAEFVEGSILDAELVRSLVSRVDSVMHLAARGSVPRSLADPALTNRVNVDGTLTMLLAARDAGAYIAVSSSSSVYGANDVSPKVETLQPLPKSPYAVSKLATESYTNAFARSFDMATLAFRFFNVFGPLQSARHVYAAVIPAFMSAMLDGQPVTVHGDGRQSRDFTYVDSVVGVLCDALERQVTHPTPVNLAFGTNTDLLDLLARIASVLDLDGYQVEHAAPRAGDVRLSLADTTQLLALFPDATPTPLDDALAATARWFRDTGGVQA